MKQNPAKATRPRTPSPDCDGSPPYPPKPPPTGEIPGEAVLNFIYFGEQDFAKAFNGGQLVQHTMNLDDGEAIYIFSLRGGPHKRRTLSKLDVKVLLGPCKIVIQNGSTTTLQTNGTIIIPAGSTFSLEAEKEAVVYGKSVAGPGLGGPTGNPRDP